jgi:hypothetical protein
VEEQQVVRGRHLHKDFLRTYLNEHLFPVAERFATLAMKHKGPLVSGEGLAVDGEPRLVPRD